ncbi:hypothetical protein B7486_26095 [cyanobacterium TDX16]|nr:hypothetical protein B7486_26095 [cyanobacterium TDX16]
MPGYWNILQGMWKEYSRETPGRPRLGIFSAGIALAGTTALAWIVTAQSNPLVAAKLAHWPIRFSIPQGAEQIFLNSSGQESSQTLDSGGEVSYRIPIRAGGGSELDVTYLMLEAGTTLKEACEELELDDTSQAEPRSFGEFHGILVHQVVSEKTTTISATCIGVHPSGLVVRFRLTMLVMDFSRLRLLDQILDSVMVTATTISSPTVVMIFP